jgi:GT2 family glycosyltransferase
MISTITVNYKTVDYIETLLDSLFAFHSVQSIEVIVVENGSGDDVSKLQAKFPYVKFICSEKNLGFAGGCNLGAKSATGDFLLLLNPDVIFVDDALTQIEKTMQQNPDVGIGGISLKNLDGTQQACVWRFPTPVDQLLLLAKVPHLFPLIAPVAKWRMADFDYTKSQDVDQVMGAFFCIRRDVYERLHGLDDGFFLWYEEVDFAKRTKDAGYRVRYFSNIQVKHKKGSSFERVTTFQKQEMVRRSLRRYMRKHYGYGTWLLFTILNPFFVVLGYIASLIKPL